MTGGIGSGKSAVARFFSDWGAVVIDADVLAREVVEPGTAAFAQIGAAWPSAVTPQGSLDRAALSRMIFADVTQRERLTAIVHPRVRERADRLEAAAPAGSIVVHVVPLLFEGDFWRTCDRTVLVVAPRARRIERVVARDGLDPQAVEVRMAAQIDPEVARSMADEVIENDADLRALEARARDVYVRFGRRPAA